jgi:transcriptional regulator with XRE-family HTH domain
MALFNPTEIGQRITEERRKLNLNRDRFAEMLGLTPYYIGQLERGDRQMSIDTLIKVSDCLHISLDYLLKGQKDTPADATELQELINQCSPEEIDLITDVLKTALPHLRRR